MTPPAEHEAPTGPAAVGGGRGVTDDETTGLPGPARHAAPETPEPVTVARLAREALDRSGGLLGLAAAAAPAIAFVVANTIGGLAPALVVLGLTASAVFGVRVARREPVRGAIGGVAVAAVYALVAAVTGEARAFFLVPTLLPAVLAVLCLATVLARRPVTGLLFNRMAGGPREWPRHRRLLRVHTVSTLAASVVNGVNAVVQGVFYLDDRPAALAVAHVTIWPVFAVLVAATLVAARRAAGDTAVPDHGGVGTSTSARSGRRRPVTR